MANFDRSDLKLTHYSSTATGEDDPKLTGSPDSDLFNRAEVYEVVYMLNKVLETLGSEKNQIYISLKIWSKTISLGMCALKKKCTTGWSKTSD